MAEIGVAPHIVEAALNHISGAKAGVAGVYNRAQYAAEKKAALARWAQHVEGHRGPAALVTSSRWRRSDDERERTADIYTATQRTATA